MLPDRVSNPGPLTYESGALPIALRDPACISERHSTGITKTNALSPNCSLLTKISFINLNSGAILVSVQLFSVVAVGTRINSDCFLIG